MFTHYLHLAVSAINQTVGDWTPNRLRILEVLHKAHNLGVQILLFPEMSLSGYSFGDRLLRLGTLHHAWDSLEKLLTKAPKDLTFAVGLPIYHEGVIFNAMALVAQGKIQGLVAKENLASGDVEYENRYFQNWPHGRLVHFHSPSGESIPLGTQVFDLQNLAKIGFEICEDSWKGLRPGSTLALAGAEILLNPSASWFVIGKHQKRRRMVQQISLEDHCIYLYASLLGCDATRLVFDGSTFIAENGKILEEGPRFVFDQDWTLVHHLVDLSLIRQLRMEEGSWREQHDRLHFGVYGSPPQITHVHMPKPSVASPPPLQADYWTPPQITHPDPSLKHFEKIWGHSFQHSDIPHIELELTLSLGLYNYVKKSGVSSLCLALSGGRDSAMVAWLVHQMFRYAYPHLDAKDLHALIRQKFITAYLATQNSSEQTHFAAQSLAQFIGATFYSIDIQNTLAATQKLIANALDFQWSWDQHDIPLQNVQARLRGTLIWTIANLHQALLLVTSNKSEAAVGYTTMDGDSSGGIAPIADVPKSLIILYLNWVRQFHKVHALSPVLELQASAELRPQDSNQTDEDDLMPFHILDQIMFAFVQLGLDPLQIFHRLWPQVQPFYAHPKDFALHIQKFVTLFCRAQWKRERFAISFRVTAFDLDPKTGYRFPPIQNPFEEELLALMDYVQNLPDS